jgi:hypothetical protein
LPGGVGFGFGVLGFGFGFWSGGTMTILSWTTDDRGS